jgi:Na+/melibiose symporter-like transporter
MTREQMYAITAIVWFIGMVVGWLLMPEDDHDNPGAMMLVMVWPLVALVLVPMIPLVVPVAVAAILARSIRKSIRRRFP